MRLQWIGVTPNTMTGVFYTERETWRHRSIQEETGSCRNWSEASPSQGMPRTAAPTGSCRQASFPGEFRSRDLTPFVFIYPVCGHLLRQP